MFGPTPRSYDFKLPKKVERGALRAALAQKMKDGALVVVDTLSAGEVKTKAAAALLARLGVTGKAVLVDVALDDKLALSVRNIPGVTLVQSARLTARQVADAGHVVATQGALEKLQEALAPAAMPAAASAERAAGARHQRAAALSQGAGGGAPARVKNVGPREK